MVDTPLAETTYTTEWQGVVRKDTTVNVSDLVPTLQTFLSVAGRLHIILFGSVLVVTSGKDGYHVLSSKHGEGKAVDLRITDLPLQDRPAWLAMLRVLCERLGLAMFDESFAPGMGHVHVEIAG